MAISPTEALERLTARQQVIKDGFEKFVDEELIRRYRGDNRLRFIVPKQYRVIDEKTRDKVREDYRVRNWNVDFEHTPRFYPIHRNGAIILTRIEQL